MKTFVLKSTELAGVYQEAPMNSQGKQGVCTGCAFIDNGKACAAADDCVNVNIIWVKKEDKQ